MLIAGAARAESDAKDPEMVRAALIAALLRVPVDIDRLGQLIASHGARYRVESHAPDQAVDADKAGEHRTAENQRSVDGDERAKP